MDAIKTHPRSGDHQSVDEKERMIVKESGNGANAYFSKL